MQIQQTNGPVRSVGAAGQSGSFSIAMNGKAFRVLSDTMYQDKIGSIMREISCNALDSHIMAGNPDRPFTLHLPDGFEPWVSFRDYGVGLSPESVQNVFCVYFQSTKDQSNDAVGAFGLGAKTPFSYTDQFNVTSVFAGRKYMYSAFINGDGIPEIQLMAETETTEENGVEIKIGVEPKDFDAFIHAAKTQLRYFPVKPEVTNYRNGQTFVFDEESGKVLFESSTVKIFSNTVYGRAKMHIIQGPVGYPLDVNQVIPHLDDTHSKFLKTINSIGANLYFNIGEIGVTASREGVEYKGITIDSLRTRISDAYRDVLGWITNEVNNLPTVYEKAVFVNSRNEFSELINGINLDLSPAIRNYSGNYYFSLGGLPEFKVEIEQDDGKGGTVTRQVNAVSITKYTCSGLAGFSGSRTTTDDVTIFPSAKGKIIIALRDTTKNPIAKMRHYFKENKVDSMIAISPKYDNLVMDDVFIDAIKVALGGFSDIVRVSEMADPPRETVDRVRAGYSRPTAYKAPGISNIDMESVASWGRVYDKLDELRDSNGDALKRALYVEVDRQRVQSCSHTYKQLYKDLYRADVMDLPLYAIRTNDVAKLADTGIEWIKLEDYVSKLRDEIREDNSIKRYVIANEIHGIIQSTLGHRFSELQGLNPRTTLARLLRVGDKANKLRSSATVNAYKLRIAGYDAENHPAIVAARNASQTVFAKTPMVNYVARSGYGILGGDEAQHVVDYINMCYRK